MPNQTLTPLEVKVLDVIDDVCGYDYSASIGDIVEETNLKVNTIKGVLGSLVKKNKIFIDQEREGVNEVFNDIFPLNEKNQTKSFDEWS